MNNIQHDFLPIITLYTRQGLKIFPCSMEKKPLTEHGFKDATTDVDTLSTMFKPGNLIGLPTGNDNGIVVLDLDVKEGITTDNLLEELKTFGDIPDTLSVRTMNGGLHLYFKTENTNLKSAARFLNKNLPIDIRANGGYIIAPDYKNYFPSDVDDISDIKSLMAPLPAWVESYKKSDALEIKDLTSGADIPEGQRNDSLYRLAAIYWQRGHSKQQVLVKVADDNKNRCKPPLPVREVNAIVESATKDDPYTITDTFILQCFFKEEIGDAELLIKLCKGKFLYNITTKKWMSMDHGVWKEGLSFSINNIALSIYRQYEKISVGEDYVKNLKKRIATLKTKNRIKSIIEIATWLLGEPTTNFDTDPYTLNLCNGVYNLKNFTFSEHQTCDRFLQQSSARYDSSATCLFTLNFFDEIFEGNSEIIDFVQQLFGIYLTGSVDNQFFIYCYGGGKNGKSTFFNILKKLLGTYYATLNTETILQKTYSNTNEYYLARLYGKRLIVCSEIPQNRSLNEAQVKNMTGGDTITGRPIYGHPIEFNPTHKLALFGNHLLNINGTDDGIWRRVCLIPFNYKIPDDKLKPQSEMEEEFEKEMSGILNWAIEGYKKYKEKGKLIIPEVVTKASSEYKEDSDTLAEFLNYTLSENNIMIISIKSLFDKYHEFMKTSKSKPSIRSSNMLTRELKKRGYTVENREHNKTYLIGYDFC